MRFRRSTHAFVGFNRSECIAVQSAHLAAQCLATEFPERDPKRKKVHDVIQRPPVPVQRAESGLRRHPRGWGCAHHHVSHGTPPVSPWKEACGMVQRRGGGLYILDVLKGRVEAHEGKELRSSLLGYRPFKPAVGFETQEVCAFLVVKGG